MLEYEVWSQDHAMLRARLIYLSELLQRHGFTPSSGALVS